MFVFFCLDVSDIEEHLPGFLAVFVNVFVITNETKIRWRFSDVWISHCFDTYDSSYE